MPWMGHARGHASKYVQRIIYIMGLEVEYKMMYVLVKALLNGAKPTWSLSST